MRKRFDKILNRFYGAALRYDELCAQAEALLNGKADNRECDSLLEAIREFKMMIQRGTRSLGERVAKFLLR